MYKYIADFIPQDTWKIKCPFSMQPQFIVVHNTANDASAANEISFMRNNSNSISFHIAIDDIEVRQAIPLNRNAWHATDGNSGKGNRQGIGIEICYSKSGGARFNQAEDNAAQFIASLLKENNWDISRVKKHQDFSNKYCPHRTLDLGWDRFLKKVADYMITELTTPNDICWQLAQYGIISDTDGMVKEMEANPDGRLYWLGRKAVNYIRGLE